MAQTVLGTATSASVIELVAAILARQPAAGLDAIHKSLDAGSDPRQFARQVVDYLRGLLLIRMGNGSQVEATPEIRVRMAEQAQGFSIDHLLATLQQFNTAAIENRIGWQPGLMLEMALAECVDYQHPQAQSVQQVIVQSVSPVAQPQVTREAIPQADPQSAPSSQPTTNYAEPQGSETALTTQILTQNWARIRSIMKKRQPQTEALLNSCKSIALKDGVLILGFLGQVLKSKMETPDNIELTRQIIQQVCGTSVPIQCVVLSSKGATMPQDVDEPDGMVSAALNLGGQIVHKE